MIYNFFEIVKIFSEIKIYYFWIVNWIKQRLYIFVYYNIKIDAVENILQLINILCYLFIYYIKKKKGNRTR